MFSIGHSNHTLEHVISLLKARGIEVVADVRSQPYSRHCPHFNTQPLRAALQHEGMGYVFLGKELGGRWDGDEFYDEAGHLLFFRVAQTAMFQAGISRLETGAKRYRIAIMCSEENPEHCHRHHLVGRVLARRGLALQHIRGNGHVEAEPVRFPDGGAHQLVVRQATFDEMGAAGAAAEDWDWRSPWTFSRSGSRNGRQPPSSVP